MTELRRNPSRSDLSDSLIGHWSDQFPKEVFIDDDDLEDDYLDDDI